MLLPSELFKADAPPPTISGELHLGHFFSYAHMDFCVRYQKTQNRQTLYTFGFDNNGLPTYKLGRKLKLTAAEDILDMSKKIGSDYRQLLTDQLLCEFGPQSYYTSDENSRRLAELSFDDLVKKGYLYQAEADYLYCPKDHTAVSQSELDDSGRVERSGEYPIMKRGMGYFIHMVKYKKELIEAINQINWKPDLYRIRLLSWVDNINMDWSIARDRQYGISIPGDSGLTFDTWFISSLTPQIVWSGYTNNISLECPIFDARFQGHDILRTWALFTIAKSLYHNSQIPWHNVYVSGHALDKDGKKLSKSSPNYHPTTYYFDKYGGDAIRYWAASSALGSDTKLDEAAMLTGKKLLNKLRNAVRFINLQTPNDTRTQEWEEDWENIEGRLVSYFNNSDWNEGMILLRDFFWHTYCDKWIEESKSNIKYFTMRSVLARMLVYFQIFMPSVSELCFE